jgi:pimeloyl-[acyl-carrier protein] methyl ester esterase
MTLNVRTQGQGRDLVLLHGWALHAGVWDDIGAALERRYRVHYIDLPGHGLSDLDAGIETLQQFAAVIAPHVPQQSIVMGWSLGGLVALQLATQIRMDALILISSTPKFVAGEHWPAGMAPPVFEQFVARLHSDFAGTVQDFLSLQVRGDKHAPETLRVLKARLLQHPPQERALDLGLKLLRDSDLRAALPDIHARTLLMAGEHDRITPPAAGQYLAAQLPQAQLNVMRRAGHAPFLSHREEFVAEVERFLEGQP